MYSRVGGWRAMSEQPEAPVQDGAEVQRGVFTPAAGFPWTPCVPIYSDGISNVSIGPHVVKIYFVRTDPEMSGTVSFKNQAVAQLFMPTDQFVSMIIFLQEIVDRNLKSGQIDNSDYEKIKQATLKALQDAQQPK